MSKLFLIICVPLTFCSTLVSMVHIEPTKNEMTFVSAAECRPTPTKIKARKILQNAFEKIGTALLSDLSLFLQRSFGQKDLENKDTINYIYTKLTQQKEDPLAQQIIFWCKVLSFIKKLKRETSPYISLQKLESILSDIHHIDLASLILISKESLLTLDEAHIIANKPNAIEYYTHFFQQKQKEFDIAKQKIVNLHDIYLKSIARTRSGTTSSPDPVVNTLQQLIYYLSYLPFSGEEVNNFISAIKAVKNPKQVKDVLPLLQLNPYLTSVKVVERDIKSALVLLQHYIDKEQDTRKKVAFTRILQIGNYLLADCVGYEHQYVKISPLLSVFLANLKLTNNPFSILFELDELYKIKFCRYCMEEKSDTAPLQLCSGCTTAYYCSKECQKSDWKEEHKEWCKTLGASKALTTQLSAGIFLEKREDFYLEYFACMVQSATSSVRVVSEYTENGDITFISNILMKKD